MVDLLCTNQALLNLGSYQNQKVKKRFENLLEADMRVVVVDENRIQGVIADANGRGCQW